MTRILVLIPHPDDEVVGCALALRRAVAAGDRCFGLYLTTGVPPRERLFPWQRHGYAARLARRRAEAEEAARVLNLTPVGFLDLPSRTLKSHIGDAAAAIRRALSDHMIEAIWTPAWEGGHQDHDVANVLASRFSDDCAVTEFSEYHFYGDRVRSGSFAMPNGSEETVTASAEDAAWKRSLLALYRSERGNLAHIGVAQEQRRPLARYDYTQRPHPGTLFWERFHWLPFRHPRIDHDRPEAVLEAIGALGQTPHGAVQNAHLTGDASQRVADMLLRR